MKLVDLLRKNVSEDDWPADYPYAAQDSDDRSIYFYAQYPKLTGAEWDYDGFGIRLMSSHILCEDWNTSVIYRDQFFSEEMTIKVETAEPEIPVLFDFHLHPTNQNEMDKKNKQHLRQQAAIAAMNALIIRHSDGQPPHDVIAKLAVSMADSLIKALEEKQKHD